MSNQRIDKKLTKREQDVLKLIVEEYSSVEIAGSIHLSIRTIDTHRRNIASKMGTSSLVAYTKYAIQQGWIENYSFQQRNK